MLTKPSSGWMAFTSNTSEHSALVFELTNDVFNLRFCTSAPKADPALTTTSQHSRRSIIGRFAGEPASGRVIRILS